MSWVWGKDMLILVKDVYFMFGNQPLGLGLWISIRGIIHMNRFWFVLHMVEYDEDAYLQQ